MSNTPDLPLRVAVVGSGPAGLYAAAHLLEHEAGTYLNGRLERISSSRPVEVDVFERLPTPWGLVRGGVAPDHPHKKLVSRVFEAVADRPGFRFFGNVEIGNGISVDDLREWYDAVLIAVGSAGDRSLGIPGEGLHGSWSAREFVGWYNGTPDFRDLPVTMSGEHVVVVGNGNVALDVARILVSTPDQLSRTDIADHALQTLRTSNVRHVSILGRRGPAESAFNYPEFEELMRLPDVGLGIKHWASGADGAVEPRARSWHVARKLRLLEAARARPTVAVDKSIRLHYFTSPVEVLGGPSVTGLRVVHDNPRLPPDSRGCAAESPARLTSVLACSSVIRAIGYQGRPIPGLPFDEVRCVIPNDRGRVLDGCEPVAGVYVAGWIKRGPHGVIGTNKKCARDTVLALFRDLEAGFLSTGGTVDAARITDLLVQRGQHPVDYAGWRRINHRERRRGTPTGRPRVKFTTRGELLAAASRGPIAPPTASTQQ